MKTWNKNTLKWNFSVGQMTSVHTSGELHSNSDCDRLNTLSKEYYKLHSIVSVSMPHEEGEQRKGEMILNIRTPNNSQPNTEAIVRVLKTGLDSITIGETPTPQYGVWIDPPTPALRGGRVSWMDQDYKLSFVLADREQFCDQSIEIVRGVFKSLGVNDVGGYQLASFSHKRESFVRIDSSWITFVRWLRISHRLPIYGPEDWP